MFGARVIVISKFDAVVISEIKFGKVAVQMGFAAMLINTLHAAFENREITFNRVGMDEAPCVFFLSMIDAFMAGELFANARVDVGFG